MDVLTFLVNGGIGGFISLLVVIIFYLVKDKYEKKQNAPELDRKEKREKHLEDTLTEIHSNTTQIEEIGKTVKEIQEHDKNISDPAIQALLRARLYDLYDYYIPLGYAPPEIKLSFQNMYEKYHNLGKNGVMDEKYAEFIKLPEYENFKNLENKNKENK